MIGELLAAGFVGALIGMMIPLLWEQFAEARGWLRVRYELAYPDQPWNFTGYEDTVDTPTRAIHRKGNQNYWGKPRDGDADSGRTETAARTGSDQEEYIRQLEQLVAELGAATGRWEGDWPPPDYGGGVPWQERERNEDNVQQWGRGVLS